MTNDATQTIVELSDGDTEISAVVKEINVEHEYYDGHRVETIQIAVEGEFQRHEATDK